MKNGALSALGFVIKFNQCVLHFFFLFSEFRLELAVSPDTAQVGTNQPDLAQIGLSLCRVREKKKKRDTAPTRKQWRRSSDTASDVLPGPCIPGDNLSDLSVISTLKLPFLSY